VRGVKVILRGSAILIVVFGPDDFSDVRFDLVPAHEWALEGLRVPVVAFENFFPCHLVALLDTF
jgi:hypothetical protein